jgi:hypothetical protein
MSVRRQELTQCERLIERHVDDFSGWLANGGSAPMLAQNPAAVRAAQAS